MLIFFVSLQPEICEIFKKNLPDHTCIIFTTTEPLYEFVEVKKMLPDLIFCDYAMMNHSIFSVYQQMEIHKIHVPFVFYNDPVLTTPSRSQHWKMVIQINDPYNNELNLDIFDDIFNTIARLIESPALKPYISLLQEPKPLPKKLLIDHLFNDYTLESYETSLYSYKKLDGMTDGLFFLLKILYKNQDKTNSLKDIQLEYEENNKQIKIESLKVQLSRLKTVLNRSKESRIEIIKLNEGYKIVEF